MKRAQSTRLLGDFLLPTGRRVLGTLRLTGANTLLELHSEESLMDIEDATTLTGLAYSGERITLLDCHSLGCTQTLSQGESTRYHADVFPHYVAIGKQHLNPDEACIARIEFSTSDIESLFYDLDAFGHVIDARPIIDQVLAERRARRPVEVGDSPQVFYFTGKYCIAEVNTVAGRISAHHRPRFNMGGPSGAYIKNRIAISIQPAKPLTFDSAIESMYEIRSFLSVAAGRSQRLSKIRVSLTEMSDGFPHYLEIHPSFELKIEDDEQVAQPRPGDVPLNPIDRPDEFASVLSGWMGRHADWRAARGRYLGCIRKGSNYDAERLVAAANMYDILPESAVPQATPVSQEVADARKQCIAILRKLPEGPDRNGALSALGRLGQPSLPKKVAARVSIVEACLGERFPEIQLVASIAVKLRNFYVHGGSADLDPARVEPLMPFLTDALEFVFGASDFIELGWDAPRWNREPMGWGHSFARFRSSYNLAIRELREAIAPVAP
jgi:hypothetical protein